MPIKVYGHNQAARKQASMVDRSVLHRGHSWRQLTGSKTRISGRGAEGKITIRHRGGGAKRRLRQIDFGQAKQNVPALVERIEFDPNRSAFIALLLFQDGDRRYVLAWNKAAVGDQMVIKEAAPEIPGNRLRLRHVTPGAAVYNVEMMPERGGVLFRSAGSYATVMDIQEKYALLKLPSGEMRYLPVDAWCNYGAVSNADHRLVRIGSAGRNRRLGHRPNVRGKVMNPVDHPHGGGEGAQPVGLKHPKTKWGKPALGVKTRPRGKYSNPMIVARRGKKK